DLLADVAQTDDPEPLAIELIGPNGGEVAGAPGAGDNIVVVVDELLEHGQHQHDGVLRHRDRIGAPVVGDGHLRLARGLDVNAVVARAGQLDELELGGGAEELVADARARRAQVILGLGGRVVELGLGGIGDDELHPGRKELAGDLHHGGLLRGCEDLGHDLLLTREWVWAWMRSVTSPRGYRGARSCPKGSFGAPRLGTATGRTAPSLQGTRRRSAGSRWRPRSSRLPSSRRRRPPAPRPRRVRSHTGA